MQITKVGLRNLPKTLYVAEALTAATLGMASANAQTTQNANNNNIKKVLVISEKGDTTSFDLNKNDKVLHVSQGETLALTHQKSDDKQMVVAEKTKGDKIFAGIIFGVLSSIFLGAIGMLIREGILTKRQNDKMFGSYYD